MRTTLGALVCAVIFVGLGVRLWRRGAVESWAEAATLVLSYLLAVAGAIAVITGGA